MGNAGSIDASKEIIFMDGKGLKKITFKNVDNARIVKLNLNSNKLTSLPAEIGRLTGLTHLGLSRNQLTSLPVEIGNMTGLEVLYLCNNQLTSLPVEIGMLTGLRQLLLSGNPLTTPPMKVCQEGVTAIRAYFLEHQTKARPAKSAAKTMQPVA